MNATTTTSHEVFDSQVLPRAYREADKDFRIQQAKIGCILVLICMPLGSGLEWFVYPDKLIQFFIFGRLLCDVGVLPLYFMLRGARSRSSIDFTSLAWPLLPAIAISWMIFMSEGAKSPYYAGLNLVLIVACQLMPYTLREALTVCGATLGLYLVACFGYAHTSTTPIDIGILYNNVYFISITTLICVTGSHYNTRRRMQEFGLRQELDHRNQELSQLDKLKSEFFANVSHELRTPLTLILAPTEAVLAQQATLPPLVIEQLEIVRQNGLRLLKLVTDLLEIVRADQQVEGFHREPVDLAAFVPSTVSTIKQLAEAKHIHMELKGSPKPLVVDGEPSRLEKVLLNILTNAIKFTHTGGAITVSWAAEGDQAVITCADTGIGIPANELPYIFERFRQVDGSSTRRFQGMGIGLALAKDLVQKHGGSLTATSELGKGTAFRVELPLSAQLKPSPRLSQTIGSDPIAKAYYDADRVILNPESALDWDELMGEVGTGEFKILVVEDEPDLRRFIVSLMANHHRVFQAADGQRGLEALRVHRPDLLLLDLMLPGIDGLEVCRRIKSDPETQHTKIILLTARTDEESKIIALKHGADDFLNKPFSSTELAARVNNLLKSSRLQSSLREKNIELEAALLQLKSTEVQLVQSEKMNALGKLSAGLLHEINNPLNAALMAMQVTRLHHNGPELAEYFCDMDYSLGRIKDVVSDLRAFAYPTRDILSETFTIESAITSAERLLAHELGPLVVGRDHVNGSRVTGSKNQIVHVLMNLISNAIFAVNQVQSTRAPAIVVSATRVDDRLRVTVRDNGAGIASDILNRVTEPFFTTKEVGQGMGLGLSICHTVVRNHGGALEVESQAGGWTKISFDLPLDQQEKPA